MPQYYGITAFGEKAVQKGGRQLMHTDWYVVSGPCDTKDEAEQAAFVAFGENDKSFFWSTRYKNLRIVSKSSLRKYGIYSENHGGKRQGAGRPRQYVRIEKKHHTERSEPERVTPESDLLICIAETEVDESDTRRGIVIGDIWYGAAEALAIARFVEQYRPWLVGEE